jgi:hypothetical protein
VLGDLSRSFDCRPSRSVNTALLGNLCSSRQSLPNCVYFVPFLCQLTPFSFEISSVIVLVTDCRVHASDNLGFSF